MLTLVMMVRNEGAVIQRALDSAMSRCDAAFIVDTGSTDHTVTAAVEYLDAQRCPYRIVHRTWVDFAVNRTQALQLAAQYYPEGHLLVLDADDRWEGNVSGLTGDVYDIVKASGSIEFAYPHIFSAELVLGTVLMVLVHHRGILRVLVQHQQRIRVRLQRPRELPQLRLVLEDHGDIASGEGVLERLILDELLHE